MRQTSRLPYLDGVAPLARAAPSSDFPPNAAPLAPRLLTKAAAAAYCALTGSGFDHWIASGTLPGPMKGTRRWDRVAIDIALDRLSGIDRSKPEPATPESILADWKANRAAREAVKTARPAAAPITKRRGADCDRT